MKLLEELVLSFHNFSYFRLLFLIFKFDVMKKIILSIAFCCLAWIVGAQNIQFHYDFGRDLYDEFDSRSKVTTTVEMFKGDKWGSTYFFVDMDYSKKGVTSAYWEISRELKFWKGAFSAHLEYNGGLNMINNAYLLGPTYSWNSEDFSRGFTFSALYKYIQGNDSPNNFQLTGTWRMDMCGAKYSFSGFIDFWREKHVVENGEERSTVIISEPQFWVNLNKFKFADENFNLSVGTEVEISNNFAIRDGWYVIPTLALKWSF